MIIIMINYHCNFYCYYLLPFLLLLLIAIIIVNIFFCTKVGNYVGLPGKTHFNFLFLLPLERVSSLASLFSLFVCVLITFVLVFFYYYFFHFLSLFVFFPFSCESERAGKWVWECVRVCVSVSVYDCLLYSHIILAREGRRLSKGRVDGRCNIKPVGHFWRTERVALVFPPATRSALQHWS